MKQRIIDSGWFAMLAIILFGLFVINVVFLLMTAFQNDSDYKYITFIKSQLLFSCVPMIVLGLIFLIFGLLFFKKMDRESIDNWMVIAWFTFSIVFSMYISWTISMFYLDIKNEDPVTYQGQFEKDYTRDFVFLSDEKTTRLRNTSQTFLQKGQYVGTVIYSKRSKCVLDCSFGRQEDGSPVSFPETGADDS